MEKSAVNKIENYLYILLKHILSAFMGFLISKIGIKSNISPFSITLLSLSPFTNLNPISQFLGTFLGYITKDFSISNFKYICSNIIMLSIIFISGKKYYRKIYSPILPAVICLFVGFIFLFAENLSIVSFLLLLCEAIICGCATYFVKYVIDSFNDRKRFKSKDLISLNITIILLLCAFDNYYLLSAPLSFVFIITLIYLCCYFFDRKTAFLFSLTLCTVPTILHPTKSFFFILLYIPAVVSIVISKFQRKHIVSSYILSFLSVYTMNIQGVGLGIILSPLFAAIIYIVIPKKRLSQLISDYITVYSPAEDNVNDEQLCSDYNKASIKLLKKIEGTTITPIINVGSENKIKRYMHNNGCKDVSISNYYNENGKQIITIHCTLTKAFSIEKLKNKICEVCKNEFIINKETIEQRSLMCRFEQAENYKIECFALYKAKRGETICGDNVTAFKCTNGFYYLLLADGMGSGKEAYNKSLNAINLTKKLLKSGFDLENTIETVNSAMDVLKDGVGFSTIDICKISLRTADAQFLKCGANKSYILRSNTTYSIDGGGFPVGLSEDASFVKNTLRLDDEDIVVMISDGISLTDEKVNSILLLNKCNKIEIIAKNLIEQANDENDYNDDMSVLVAKIKKQNAE